MANASAGPRLAEHDLANPALDAKPNLRSQIWSNARPPCC
jgi:hypothetical protein